MSEASQNPETEKSETPTGSPKSKEPTFVLQNVQEIGKWANYLGDFQFFEFAEPVYSSDKKILVQKDSILRSTVFANMQKRKPEELPPAFVFKYNKQFKSQCKKILRKSLYSCLDPNRYHINMQLSQASQTDFTKIGDFQFETRALLDLFISMDMDNDPLLPHLGEVAIMCAGLAEQFCDEARFYEDKNEIVKKSFLAGLLHDISLKDDPMFLASDLENAKSSKHEENSKNFISKNLKDIDSIVAQVVANHHRIDEKWRGRDPEGVSPQEIISECLAFSEFLFGEIRMSYVPKKTPEGGITGGKDGGNIEKIFFKVGQVLGHKVYHPHFLKIMAKLQRKFANVLMYGKKIGELEKTCLFGNSAVAYPTPRCTQVMCRHSNYDCKLVLNNMHINIIKPSKTLGWAGEDILPGKYPKCQLSKDLPPIPAEIESI